MRDILEQNASEVCHLRSTSDCQLGCLDGRSGSRDVVSPTIGFLEDNNSWGKLPPSFSACVAFQEHPLCTCTYQDDRLDLFIY